MESCLLDLAKNEVQSLVNLVKNEAQYLCCFNSYVENFEQKKKALAAKHKDVKGKFQKGKGVYSFKFEAQEWERDADDIIHVETKIKKKLFFEWCPNCWWQYRRGKELAEKTKHIESLLERCNSNIVAGRTNVLDIKCLSLQGFVHFESRESKFQDLLKALQDENCNVIGLQGLGGTGKTSMAKEVGHKLKEFKFIDKFIFLVISQPPDFKKIRGELAKSLDLNLDEVKEEELSSTILSRITNIDKKLLIILDDVWVKFDLTENLGIPFGHQHGGCNLLITTRSSHVCIEMGCYMIQLQALTNEEASNLFEAHASLNSSYRGFKGMPQKIVKHCGGVPIAIVAVARALKNQPISVWKDALKTLEDCGLDQNLEEAYKCLKLSYDNLKNQKAKELLLISSLFPEDYEIPTKLLIKIGIGLGSFNENEKYHLTRSEVHEAIMELMYSSLLLNGKEECVKLHDLVREVALWIGENDIQSLLDLEKPIKGNLRYLFWINEKFPDEFDGNKLEALSIFLDDSEGLNVIDAFFKKMISLKVLVLVNDTRCPALSLANSLQPLKDIQTLVLANLELGDISALGTLSSLMTLWFKGCSIIELPKEFLKLKKLRSLEVEDCEIEMNNPFEVIEMCLQLEELTFVGNEYDDEDKDAISHNGSPLTLHRYCISSEGDLSYYSKKYGLSRCFQADELSNLVSDATFKQLVERAEVLLLEGEDGKRMWKNLVPDIFPIDKQGVMNDLIVLHLSSHPNMEYLIDTKDHDPSMSAFCNLAELCLSKMAVEDLCRGPPPSGFLEQLEILELTECYELKSILFKANYNLCHLKSMQVEDSPKLMSIFQPYTARSLRQLKKLTIRNCSALEYIIVGEDGDSNQKIYYDSLFPSLEELKLSGVPSFIGIVREYNQLMSSPMHKPSPLLSRHNSNNINQSLTTSGFSWVQACCSFNKLRSASKETDITIFEDRSFDHTKPPGSLASKKWIDTAPTFVRQLVFQVCHTRKMELAGLSLTSVSKLFTLSMASMISWEELKITKFDGLKHLVTSEDDDYKEQISCHSIFPKLKNLEIRECKDLEFLFSSAISIEIKTLKSLTIGHAPKLTYIVGKYEHHHCISNQNQNDELHFDLPALEALSFEDVPEFITVGPMNFIMVSLSPQNVCSYEGQLNSNTTKELDAPTNGVAHSLVAQSLLMQSLKNVREIELVECGNITSLSTLSIVASTIALDTLTIRKCHKLKCITTDEGEAQVDKNYCSIFPRLENLEIDDCKELECVFVSTVSGGLEKLKSFIIRCVPKLKFVAGHYQKEQHSSNQNQNDELHFNFHALETLDIKDAPIMNSICSKNYNLGLSSPLTVVINTSSIKSFTDYNMVDLTTTEELDTSTDRVAPFLAAQMLSMKNVTKVELVKCWNLISLSTLSVGASTIFLETLTIRKCHKLKCITTHKGDAQVDKNYCSIFPRLENLITEHCKELEFLFISTISIGLEKLKSLTIKRMPKLKCIVAFERDAGTHMSYNSIFPELKQIQVLHCHALEYLFPAYAFRCPIYLESLRIYMAPMLKYVFGRSQHEDNLTDHDENQDIQTLIEFPNLEYLSIKDVPKLLSIYPESYYLRAVSLWSITLGQFPKFTMRSFNEFMVCWLTKQETKVMEMHQQTLESLEVRDNSNAEIIFDLTTYMDIEKKGDGLEPLTSSLQELRLLNLRELVNICVGPKCIIRFDSLQYLIISACQKLRVIFSACTVRSLPMLRKLYISNCSELVHIVEEYYETDSDDHFRHEPCFPNLEHVSVFDCGKLKHLFSIIIYDILPKLTVLEITNAKELEHVLTRRGEMKEMVMKDVLPQLINLSLVNLPKLVSVCNGINFQILKDDDQTHVLYCPNFSFYETSQVEEKVKEKLSSPLSIEPSLNMGEETQQSLFKVIGARAKEGVSSETLTSEKKVPIHTSPNLTVLHASAKIFEDEEEEEEQGNLITSQRPQSGMKADSSLSKKIETFIDGDPFVPPISTISSEQTPEAILPPSPMPKASTRLCQSPSSIIPKPSDETTTTPYGSKNQDFEVWDGTEHKLSSHSNGRQASESQRSTTAGSSNFTTDTKNDAKEIVEEGTVTEKPRITNLSSELNVVGQSSDKELNPSVVNRTDSQRASSKDELAGKVARNERIMIDPQQSTIGTQNFTKDELVGKEVQRETIMMEPQSQQETTGHDLYFRKEEEEEREDDVPLPKKSQSLTIDSSGSGNLVPNIPHPINSSEGVNNKGTNEASVVQNESKTNVTCHGDQANPSNITQIEQETSHSRGRMVESRDCAGSYFIGDTKLSVSPFYIPIEVMPSFLETNNEASIVPGVQEIIHMMKLEGFESLMFAKALETRPQLQLSTKDRSARVLCMSYRVLLDILNILTTKTPLTITEADKGLLAEHLKDAYLLGFDKDWIESIKTKVFDSEIYEVDSIQKVLKGLDNDLKCNEAMLEAIRDEEVKAARVVEVAQQEHANVMARHAHLLKERQDIIARRHQCWEIVAAKNRHFGF